MGAWCGLNPALGLKFQGWQGTRLTAQDTFDLYPTVKTIATIRTVFTVFRHPFVTTGAAAPKGLPRVVDTEHLGSVTLRAIILLTRPLKSTGNTQPCGCRGGVQQCLHHRMPEVDKTRVGMLR